MKSICSSRNIITSQFLSCWVGTLSHYSFMVFLIWVICSVLSLYKCSNSSFFFLKVLQGGYPQVELLRFFKCLSGELWITVPLNICLCYFPILLTETWWLDMGWGQSKQYVSFSINPWRQWLVNTCSEYPGWFSLDCCTNRFRISFCASTLQVGSFLMS